MKGPSCTRAGRMTFAVSEELDSKLNDISTDQQCARRFSEQTNRETIEHSLEGAGQWVIENFELLHR